jgi:hypothetical protein
MTESLYLRWSSFIPQGMTVDEAFHKEVIWHWFALLPLLKT